MPSASPEAKPRAKCGRGRGTGQAALGPDIVNVQGQPVDPGASQIVDAEMNPTHSVAQAATAKMAQGVVNDAIQAKRFITGLAEFHGVQTLDSVRCNGLPAYTPGAARDILRDGTPENPVPDAMQCTLNFWWE